MVEKKHTRKDLALRREKKNYTSKKQSNVKLWSLISIVLILPFFLYFGFVKSSLHKQRIIIKKKFKNLKNMDKANGKIPLDRTSIIPKHKIIIKKNGDIIPDTASSVSVVLHPKVIKVHNKLDIAQHISMIIRTYQDITMSNKLLSARASLEFPIQNRNGINIPWKEIQMISISAVNRSSFPKNEIHEIYFNLKLFR